MLSNKEKELWLKELDDMSGKVLIKCDLHSFFPGTPGSDPELGCRECAMAELFYQFATTAPHKRMELLDLMERGIHHLVEEKENIQIFEHPELSYDRNVN